MATPKCPKCGKKLVPAEFLDTDNQGFGSALICETDGCEAEGMFYQVDEKGRLH